VNVGQDLRAKKLNQLSIWTISVALESGADTHSAQLSCQKPPRIEGYPRVGPTCYSAERPDVHSLSLSACLTLDSIASNTIRRFKRSRGRC
jgi:hypothetical protein